MRKIRQILLLGLLSSSGLRAAELLTNAAQFVNPPRWLSEGKADAVAQKVEQKLEWSIHRVKVYFYSDREVFLAAFGRDAPNVRAFTRKNEGTVHLGPNVTAENFATVFGHELTHVILYQKYKEAIPAWLDEGMANYVAGAKKVDFRWLAKQPHVAVTTLSHPFKAATLNDVDLAYQASLGVVLMLEKKCPSLRELINLSLKKNLETFIPTYCGINDVNATFWKWVEEKGH